MSVFPDDGQLMTLHNGRLRQASPSRAEILGRLGAPECAGEDPSEDDDDFQVYSLSGSADKPCGKSQPSSSPIILFLSFLLVILLVILFRQRQRRCLCSVSPLTTRDPSFQVIYQAELRGGARAIGQPAVRARAPQAGHGGTMLIGVVGGRRVWGSSHFPSYLQKERKRYF